MHALPSASLKRLQRMLLLTMLFNHTLNFVFPLLAYLLMDAGGFSIVDAALVMAAAYLASSLGGPIIGRLVDRGWVTTPLVITFVGHLAGVLALTLTRNPYLVFVGVSSFLLGIGCVSTLSGRVLEGLTVPDRRRTMALRSYVVMNVGFALSGGLAYFFLKDHQTPLLILDVVSQALLCLVIGRINSVLAQPTAGTSELPPAASLRRVLSPHLIGAASCTLILYVCMGTQFSVLQFLYRSLGLDGALYTSQTLAVNSALVVIIGSLMPRLNPNLFVRTVIASVLVAIGLTFQPLISSLAINAVLTVCWATGEVLLMGEISRAFFHEQALQNSGTVAGLRTLIFKIALVIGPLIAVVFNPDSVLSFGLFFGAPSLAAGIGLYLLIRRADAGITSVP